MFVRERREGYGRKTSTFQPVDGSRVNGHGFFGCDVRTVLQIVVLSLLLRFEIKSCQPAEVLLAHGLIHRSPSADSLSIVVGRICPPVGLGLDVAQDHVLYGDGKAGYLPGDVGLPAAPGLAEVLEDRSGFVLLDPLGHHVKNVMHDLDREREREGERGRERERERERVS